MTKTHGAIVSANFFNRNFYNDTSLADTIQYLTRKLNPKSKLEHYDRRNAIKLIIKHLKSKFRIFRIFLERTLGDEINVLMATIAFNSMNSYER